MTVCEVRARFLQTILQICACVRDAKRAQSSGATHSLHVAAANVAERILVQLLDASTDDLRARFDKTCHKLEVTHPDAILLQRGHLDLELLERRRLRSSLDRLLLRRRLRVLPQLAQLLLAGRTDLTGVA